MTRLYLKVYLAILSSLVLCILTVALVHRLTKDDLVDSHVSALGHLVVDGLPEGEGFEAAIVRRAEALGMHLTVWDADRKPIAQSGPTLPGPGSDSKAMEWFTTDNGWGVRMQLDDGRWIASAPTHDVRTPKLSKFLLSLLALLVVLAVAAYPISRALTRRLEALGRAVDDLGAGDLTARVPVSGKDEVARLAISFNEAAGRIEQLLEAQKRVLASASHELRSPLARLRMSIEMMVDDTVDPKLAEGAKRDIEELDRLVDDILVSARLERNGAAEAYTELDLLGLAAEEAARFGADVFGKPVILMGSDTMLRRMLRNLLENARRYGGDTPIEVVVEPHAHGARLTVSDRGPGVAEADQNKIFEPFYRPGGHAEGRDGGVGLGLSLVREIATLHKGSVRYVARPGGGSTFEVTLP